MNEKSSRSHSIFQIVVESQTVDEKGMIKRSKLNFGDLAGSEKLIKGETIDSACLKELIQINQSLTTLGKVISMLAKSDKETSISPQRKNSGSKSQLYMQKRFIPFRDSKLTRLLQDSIGGNCKTCLIATVSAFSDCLEESMNTIKFAQRASRVTQHVYKNQINTRDQGVIAQLK